MSGTSSALEHDSIPPYGTAGVHEVHGLPLPEQLRRMWPETDFPDASSELPVAPKDPPSVDSVGGSFYFPQCWVLCAAHSALYSVATSTRW